jgi:calcineurin-like phosphoesterase family protein
MKNNNNPIKYWILPDCHFGHKNIIKYCNRPDNYEELIINNTNGLVREEDILLILGDLCLAGTEVWNRTVGQIKCPNKVLVIGNHDSRSTTWYYQHGMIFVCENFTLIYNGINILFSHRPVKKLLERTDINVFAHIHDNKDNILFTEKQMLCSIEKSNYCPIELEKLIIECKKHDK